MERTPLALAISIALANGSLMMSTPVLDQDQGAADTGHCECRRAAATQHRRSWLAAGNFGNFIGIRE